MGAPLSKEQQRDERRAPMLSSNIAINVITQARVTNHERLATAYDMIITSAAVLGGFAINAAVNDIKESDFGNQLAFDSYATLLVLSSVLDLYAMVALVVNKYTASRAEALSTSELQELEYLGVAGDVSAVNAELERLNQRAIRRHGEFVHRSRCYRASAVVAFVISLPCFTGALCAKQFSVQPRRHGTGKAPSLLRLASSDEAAFPPPSAPMHLPSGVLMPVDEEDGMEPFTPIRWSLAIVVFVGTCSVLLAVLGQMHLLRVVRAEFANK